MMRFCVLADAVPSAAKSRSAKSAGRAAVCGLSILAILATGVAAAGTPAPLEHLPGRWSGWGAITLSSGKSEQVKCIVTYFVNNSGGRVEQNLRCASASYKIDAKAELEVASDQVRGRWEERTNAASGSVTGRMTGSGFNLSIRGDSFTAAMAVSTSSCKQSINIAPQGTDVRRIAIGLDKC